LATGFGDPVVVPISLTIAAGKFTNHGRPEQKKKDRNHSWN